MSWDAHFPNLSKTFNRQHLKIWTVSQRYTTVCNNSIDSTHGYYFASSVWVDCRRNSRPGWFPRGWACCGRLHPSFNQGAVRSEDDPGYDTTEWCRSSNPVNSGWSYRGLITLNNIIPHGSERWLRTLRHCQNLSFLEKVHANFPSPWSRYLPEIFHHLHRTIIGNCCIF